MIFGGTTTPNSATTTNMPIGCMPRAASGRSTITGSFEAHAVERLLSDYSRCVFDFGAGHSVFEDPVLFARVKRLLAEFKYVILLLPSSDPGESQQILAQRWEDELNTPDLIDMNRHFLCHPSNRELATHVVYTESKTPEETCEEILAMVTRENGAA